MRDNIHNKVTSLHMVFQFSQCTCLYTTLDKKILKIVFSLSEKIEIIKNEI